MEREGVLLSLRKILNPSRAHAFDKALGGKGSTGGQGGRAGHHITPPPLLRAILNKPLLVTKPGMAKDTLDREEGRGSKTPYAES